MPVASSRPRTSLFSHPRFGWERKPQTRLISYLPDPKTGERIKLNHTSLLFRDASLFGMLPGLLVREFPGGAAIDIYGGARGEDGFSEALCQLFALGFKNAMRYPIKVSDLVPENMERSRQGIIGFLPHMRGDNTPFLDAWTALKGTWGSVRDAAQGQIVSNLEGFIDREPLDEKEYGHFLVKNEKNTPSQGNIWYHRFQHEQLFRIKQDVFQQLASFLHFEEMLVDVVTALAQPPAPGSKPRVVMLRNILHLLQEDQKQQLFENLRKNLPVGSWLIFDRAEQEEHLPAGRFVRKLVYEGGYEPVRNLLANDRIYRKVR